MTLLHPNSSDDAILRFVRAWIARLAERDYEGAMEVIPGKGWTSDLLRQGIETYARYFDGHEDLGHRVTPIDTVSGGVRPEHTVDWFDPHRGYVWFNLPLDGAWSDLVAQFDLTRSPAGIEIELTTLHVP